MQTFNRIAAGDGESGSGEIVVDAAARIGCDPLYLQALLNVESKGKPFDERGRVIFLPEKHKFYKYIPTSLRGSALRRGLAAKSWKRANYKGIGSTGTDRRWKFFQSMCELHEEAGLKSASYGKPQIMGFNYSICGYGSVHDFVLAMAAHEDNQDKAFIAFLEHSGLRQALVDQDTEYLTRRYNGSGQVKKYSGLVRAEYAKLKRESGSVSPKGQRNKIKRPRKLFGLRMGAEGFQVRSLQERLCELGYHVHIDGDFGPATRRAVINFQADHDLRIDGIAGPQTMKALEKGLSVQDQLGEGRKDLTIKDLRKRGSKTIKSADRVEQKGLIALVTGVLMGLPSNLSETLDIGWLQSVTDSIDELRTAISPLLDIVKDNVWLVIIMLGIGAYYYSRKIKQRRLQDAVEWRHVG